MPPKLAPLPELRLSPRFLRISFGHSLPGCGEYGYPALDVSGWVLGVPERPDAITAYCEAAPLGDRIDNATLLCGVNGVVPPGGDVADYPLAANSRACFPDWETYLDAAKNKSWIIFLGSTDSTPISP